MPGRVRYGFGLTVEKREEDGRWYVGLPHHCGSWDLASVVGREVTKPGLRESHKMQPLTKEEALLLLRELSDQARAAYQRLAKKGFGYLGRHGQWEERG